MKIKKNLSIWLISLVFSLLFFNSAFSHGYVTVPKSRAYLCHQANSQGHKNEDCGPIQWEPQSVEQVTHTFINNGMNGHIPSANVERFKNEPSTKGLDDQMGERWKKNVIEAGQTNFVWHHTANHATTGYRFYMTKPGWDPNKPLTRSDFDDKPFCALSYGGVRPPADLTIPCNVPERQGYQVILAVWDVDDTVNSFYQVIDVKFSDGGTPAPVFDWNVVNNTAKNWLVNADLGDINVGDEVSLQIHSQKSQQSYSIEINNNNRNTWPDELAEKINNENSTKYGLIRVGLFDNGSKDIFYQKNADNKVFINMAHENADIHYQYSWTKKSIPEEPNGNWHKVGKPLAEHQAKVIVGQGLKFRLFDSQGHEVNEGKEPVLTITAENKNSWQKALAELVNHSAYPIQVQIGVLDAAGNAVETPNHSYEKYGVYISNMSLSKEFRYELDSVTPDPNQVCTYSFKVTNNWGSGYQAELIVNNMANTAIHNWKMSFPANSAISTIRGWNGIFTLEDGVISINHEAWNSTITANGGKVPGVGFTAELSKPVSDTELIPATLTLNNKQCQRQ